MNLPHRLQLHIYLYWAVVVGIILVSALIVLPFVGAIIATYILAYFIRPLFFKLRPRFGKSLAAVLCIIITTILVVVPISLISLQILGQAGEVAKSQDAFVAQPFLKSLNVDPVALKAWMTLTINNVINSAIQSIPSFGISLVIILNGMFYLLCNWDELASHLKKYLPFKDNERMITRFGETTDAIVRGHVVISVLEAVVAFVGFSLIGVGASLIFSVLIFILAFVPSIGPFLIWGPLALYYLSINQYFTMFGVIITGLILMVGIEFFLYTRFVGSRSHIHPFIMLIGVLGGIVVFGVFGFVIGPLLLATSIEIIEGAITSNKTSFKKR